VTWDELLVEIIVKTLLVVVALVLFVGVPVVIYAEITGPESNFMQLRKSEWVCTQHISKQNPMIVSGGVALPMGTSKKCVQWTAQ
jgi:hypothetical protein